MHPTRHGIRTSRPVAGMRTAVSWLPSTRRGSQRRPCWIPGTAVLQPLPFDKTTDYASMAWLPDGRMIALRIGMRSTLWRFAPAQE